MAIMASAYGLSSCGNKNLLPVIDTHQHLWDLEMFPLGWVKPPLNRNYLMEDYLSAVEGQNLVQAIYMEVGVPPDLREKEARWAMELCSRPDNPTEGAVIKADPGDTGFEDYLKGFGGNPHLKGVRYSFGGKVTGFSKLIIDNLRVLGEIGLSFDLNLPPGKLGMGRILLDKCPETPFILNHCGNADPVAFFPPGRERPRDPNHNADQWYRDMEDLARRPNIVCKISGIVDNVPGYPLSADDLKPVIDHCFEVFGSDRVMFGGDWPVCLRNMSLSGWIAILKELVIDRPIQDQRKLFHDNALEFYGLEKQEKSW
jgi:predicted TIM-barrel fold metal-dependent hydrolase